MSPRGEEPNGGMIPRSVGDCISGRYLPPGPRYNSLAVEINKAIREAKTGAVDLDTVDTEDLLRAIVARYQNSVFVFTDEPTNAGYVYNMRPVGNGITVLGLLEWGAMTQKMKLCGQHAAANQPPEDED